MDNNDNIDSDSDDNSNLLETDDTTVIVYNNNSNNLVFFSDSNINNPAKLMLLIANNKSLKTISQLIGLMNPDDMENINTAYLIRLISKYKKIKNAPGFMMEAIADHKWYNLKHGVQHHHWKNRLAIINMLLAKGLNLNYDGETNLLSLLLQTEYKLVEYRIGQFLAFIDILTTKNHPFTEEAAHRIFEKIQIKLSRPAYYASTDKLFYKIVSRIQAFDSRTKLFKKLCRDARFTESNTYTLLMDRQTRPRHYDILTDDIYTQVEVELEEEGDNLQIHFNSPLKR